MITSKPLLTSPYEEVSHPLNCLHWLMRVFERLNFYICPSFFRICMSTYNLGITWQFPLKSFYSQFKVSKLPSSKSFTGNEGFRRSRPRRFSGDLVGSHCEGGWTHGCLLKHTGLPISTRNCNHSPTFFFSFLLLIEYPNFTYFKYMLIYFKVKVLGILKWSSVWSCVDKCITDTDETPMSPLQRCLWCPGRFDFYKWGTGKCLSSTAGDKTSILFERFNPWTPRETEVTRPCHPVKTSV